MVIQQTQFLESGPNWQRIAITVTVLAAAGLIIQRFTVNALKREITNLEKSASKPVEKASTPPLKQ